MIFRLILSLAFFYSWIGPSTAEEKTLLVHYMPWFSSKPISGNWGWHWTMGKTNPDQKSEDKHDIASHYHPLIGPYDSGDPDVLECHVLLMKLAGIDGVVFDWYGIADHFDYAMVHRNSQLLVKYVKKAGLQFAVCYEDNSLRELVKAKKVESNQQVAHGQQVMDWLDRNWFRDEDYVRIDGAPVLLVFGPRYLNKQQLEQSMSKLPNQPMLFALPHLSSKAGADGCFAWPPVNGGKEITQEIWRDYLTKVYDRNEPKIATVFPQFHDYYGDANLHDSYGHLGDRNGQTFAETYRRAQKSDASIVQIATWNDFGEGTIIEPTKENGYRYLEFLRLHEQADQGVTAEDLKTPVLLYFARKHFAGDAAITATLDRASDLLFQTQTQDAKAILLKLLPNKR